MQAAVETVESAEGAIGALVNNAGIQEIGAIETLPMDRVRGVFETNVFGPGAARPSSCCRGCASAARAGSSPSAR